MAETMQGKWIKVEQIGGNAPGPRCSHSMAVVGDKLYMFGGELKVNTQIDKDLYVFDFNTHTWSIAPANGEVPNLSCFGVRMVAVGTKIYIFGGRDENRNFSDFYSYDTVKEEWKFLTKLDHGEGLEVRTFHSMTSDDNHVYVFGGVSKGGSQVAPYRLRTVEAYNIADGKWSQLPDPGKNFEKRGGSGFVVVEGKIWVVFGMASSIEEGGKNNYESKKIQYFDLATGKWTEVVTKGAKPTARSVFAHAAIGKYIIIFGGEAWMDQEGHKKPGTLSNEGYALNTETLVWTKLVDQGEPESPVGWTAHTTATVYGMKGLLMHGGKQPFNNRIDDLYFYAFSG